MSLAPLMRLYADLNAQLAQLDKLAAPIKATLKTVEDQITAHLPPDAQQTSHTFDDGVTVLVKRGETSRFVPRDGESDLFYAWLQQHQLFDWYKRDFLQTKVDEFVKQHGMLPPNLVTMTTKKTTVTVKGAAPATVHN